MIIRQAREEDVRQIAEILVEDWQTAYRGIMDDDFLDSLSAAQRFEIEIKRYQKYVVAADELIGMVDRCRFQVQLCGIQLRVIKHIGVFVKDKCVSALEDRDVFHFLLQHLIVYFNADHADKLLHPVNGYII